MAAVSGTDWAWTILICLNLIAFSASAGIYSLLVARWIRRREWLLALANSAVLVVAVVIVAIFLIAFMDPIPVLVARYRHDGLGNSLVFVLLFFPALTRMLELRREHVQDARARQMLKVVHDSAQDSAQEAEAGA